MRSCAFQWRDRTRRQRVGPINKKNNANVRIPMLKVLVKVLLLHKNAHLRIPDHCCSTGWMDCEGQRSIGPHVKLICNAAHCVLADKTGVFWVSCSGCSGVRIEMVPCNQHCGEVAVQNRPLKPGYQKSCFSKPQVKNGRFEHLGRR